MKKHFNSQIFIVLIIPSLFLADLLSQLFLGNTLNFVVLDRLYFSIITFVFSVFSLGLFESIKNLCHGRKALSLLIYWSLLGLGIYKVSRFLVFWVQANTAGILFMENLLFSLFLSILISLLATLIIVRLSRRRKIN